MATPISETLAKYLEIRDRMKAGETRSSACREKGVSLQAFISWHRRHENETKEEILSRPFGQRHIRSPQQIKADLIALPTLQTKTRRPYKKRQITTPTLVEMQPAQSTKRFVVLCDIESAKEMLGLL